MDDGRMIWGHFQNKDIDKSDPLELYENGINSHASETT